MHTAAHVGLNGAMGAVIYPGTGDSEEPPRLFLSDNLSGSGGIVAQAGGSVGAARPKPQHRHHKARAPRERSFAPVEQPLSEWV